MIHESTLQLSDDFTDSTAKLPTDSQLNTWINAALIHSGSNGIYTVNVQVVTTQQSRELNHNYRSKDKPTNILSFSTNIPDFVDITPKPLGDLVICYDVLAQESSEQEKPLLDHWAHLIIHGCLHLLGYDHQDDADAEEMEAIEIQLLDDMGIKNPYI